MNVTANPTTSGIEPFYFDSLQGRLFGCYQASTGAVPKQTGVVMCYPAGHEYIRCHRTFRQMAVRLARIGYPVLRFDFFGCGDSAGDYRDARIDDWLADIDLAMDQLRLRCGLAHICLVGMRLGGALAAQSAAKRGDVDTLVLWDPVVDGNGYLAEIRDYHRLHARQIEVEAISVQTRDTHQPEAHQEEVVGYPLTAAMADDLGTLDLTRLPQLSARQILVVATDNEPAGQRLTERFTQLGCRSTLLRFEEPKLWRLEPYQAVVPHQNVQAVISWMAKACQ